MNDNDLLHRMKGLGADGPTPSWNANDLLPAGRRLRRRRARGRPRMMMVVGGVSSGEDSSEIEDDEDTDLSFRVIVVSDCKEVVDIVCQLEDQEPAKHGDLYDGLDDLIDELDEVDIDVRWYCVPEGVNKEAAALANQALEGHFEGHTKEYKPKKDQ